MPSTFTNYLQIANICAAVSHINPALQIMDSEIERYNNGLINNDKVELDANLLLNILTVMYNVDPSYPINFPSFRIQQLMHKLHKKLKINNETKIVEYLATIYCLSMYFSINTQYEYGILSQYIMMGLQFIEEYIAIHQVLDKNKRFYNVDLKKATTKSYETINQSAFQLFSDGLVIVKQIVKPIMQKLRYQIKQKALMELNSQETLPEEIITSQPYQPFCVYFMWCYSISHITMVLQSVGNLNSMIGLHETCFLMMITAYPHQDSPSKRLTNTSKPPTDDTKVTIKRCLEYCNHLGFYLSHVIFTERNLQEYTGSWNRLRRHLKHPDIIFTQLQSKNELKPRIPSPSKQKDTSPVVITTTPSLDESSRSQPLLIMDNHILNGTIQIPESFITNPSDELFDLETGNQSFEVKTNKVQFQSNASNPSKVIKGSSSFKKKINDETLVREWTPDDQIIKQYWQLDKPFRRIALIFHYLHHRKPSTISPSPLAPSFQSYFPNDYKLISPSPSIMESIFTNESSSSACRMWRIDMPISGGVVGGGGLGLNCMKLTNAVKYIEWELYQNVSRHYWPKIFSPSQIVFWYFHDFLDRLYELTMEGKGFCPDPRHEIQYLRKELLQLKSTQLSSFSSTATIHTSSGIGSGIISRSSLSNQLTSASDLKKLSMKEKDSSTSKSIVLSPRPKSRLNTAIEDTQARRAQNNKISRSKSHGKIDCNMMSAPSTASGTHSMMGGGGGRGNPPDNLEVKLSLASQLAAIESKINELQNMISSSNQWMERTSSLLPPPSTPSNGTELIDQLSSVMLSTPTREAMKLKLQQDEINRKANEFKLKEEERSKRSRSIVWSVGSSDNNLIKKKKKEIEFIPILDDEDDQWGQESDGKAKKGYEKKKDEKERFLGKIPTKGMNLEYVERLKQETNEQLEKDRQFRENLENIQEKEKDKLRFLKLNKMKEMREDTENEIKLNQQYKAMIEETKRKQIILEKLKIRQEIQLKEEMEKKERIRIKDIKYWKEQAEKVQLQNEKKIEDYHILKIKEIFNKKEMNEIIRRNKEEERMKLCEERRREIEYKKDVENEKKLNKKLENLEKIYSLRDELRRRIRHGNFIWHHGKYDYYDGVRQSTTDYIEYETEDGQPFYYDPTTKTITYRRPRDVTIRHYRDIEREEYDAQYGEGAYDAKAAEIAFKDGVNRDGGYYDDGGNWVVCHGNYDENYEWVGYEGYYNEEGRYILYPKIVGDLSFMV